MDKDKDDYDYHTSAVDNALSNQYRYAAYHSLLRTGLPQALTLVGVMGVGVLDAYPSIHQFHYRK
jgi:hypothetical protein